MSTSEVVEEIIAGLHGRGGSGPAVVSIEAEQAVIGGLLTDPRALDRVTPIIGPGDLYRADHRLIFAAVAVVAESGAVADVITVLAHLEARGQIDEAGGLAYLGELAHNTPSTAAIESWAELVAQAAHQRRLCALGAELAERAREPGADVDALARGAAEALSTATQPTREPLLLSAGDLLRDLRAPTMMIAGRKPANAIGVEFGPWGLGKTVATFSEALRIALGLPVFGQRVTAGPVVYVLAEGSAAPRLAAWQAHHRHALADAQILFSCCAVPLLQPGQAEVLRREIDAAACRWRAAPAAIYVDTIARNFGNGDPDTARISVNEWRDLAVEAGAIGPHRNNFYKVRDGLIERGCITVNNAFVSVNALDEAT